MLLRADIENQQSWSNPEQRETKFEIKYSRLI